MQRLSLWTKQELAQDEKSEGTAAMRVEEIAIRSGFSS
jgi:hypothetical protein